MMITGINPLDRLNAPGFADAPGVGPAAAVAHPGASFASALAEATSNTVATLDRAEAVSLKALQGDASTREVADAVMSAEQALQAAIAIRDKIVTAYLEISRMQI